MSDTDQTIINNVIIGSGGSNQVTVYSSKVSENYTKKLVSFTPPKSFQKRNEGPNATKIIDLLRIETRFTVDGYVDRADRTKLRNCFKTGGIIIMVWDGDNYDINIEKLNIDKSNREDQDEYPVTFTVLVGEEP